MDAPAADALDLAAKVSIDSLLLIVIGAHLRAEIADRPIGYRLRQAVQSRVDQSADAVNGQPRPPLLAPVVCTDLWYLNEADLLHRPTIAIGDPGVNAATAYFCTRVPTAFVLEDRLRIHLDPEMIEPHACLWGVAASETVAAVDLFIERYLDAFLQAAD